MREGKELQKKGFLKESPIEKRVKAYEKGRRLEYKVKTLLEKKGYLVIRSAKSGSPFDLVAFNQEKVKFIQVKSNPPTFMVKQFLARIRVPQNCEKIIFYPLKEKGLIEEKI